jgi:hypothetical protein
VNQEMAGWRSRSLWLFARAQGFEVGFVLCPPGQPLVENQRFTTDKYSTPLELSDSINARQSSGSGIALLGRHSPKLEQNLQPFRRRKSAVIIARGCFRLAESSELGDDRLHSLILSPDARNSYGKA